MAAADARWSLSLVTLMLMIGGLVGSAIAVSQAISRTDLSRYRQTWLALTSTALAVLSC